MPQAATDKRNIKYIKDTDILFIHLAPWVYYYGDEVADGVFVMRSDKDDRILGFEILDYSRKNSEQIKELLASEGFEIEAFPLKN
jgi:uncharacterized protein YuzE